MWLGRHIVTLPISGNSQECRSDAFGGEDNVVVQDTQTRNTKCPSYSLPSRFIGFSFIAETTYSPPRQIHRLLPHPPTSSSSSTRKAAMDHALARTLPPLFPCATWRIMGALFPLNPPTMSLRQPEKPKRRLRKQGVQTTVSINIANGRTRSVDQWLHPHRCIIPG